MNPTEAAPRSGQRLHGLDTLRAHMMLLGVLFHAALNYTHAPANPSWPMHDTAISAGLSTFVSIITVFRMPLFFMMAGFFFCLLLERRGVRNALIDRTQRIILPLLLFLPAMFGLCGYGFHLGMQFSLQPTQAFEFDWMQLYHLWFLYFLAFYYALGTIFSRIHRWFGRHPRHEPAILLALSGSIWIVLFAALLWVGSPLHLGASISFIPNPDSLVYYCFFFFLGYWLYRHLPILKLLEQRFWWVLLFSLIFGGLSLAAMALSKAPLENMPFWQWLLVACAQLGSFFTIIAGYLRWVKKPSPWGTYFSAASYWVYLIHLPLVIWFATALATVDIWAEAKFLINCGLTLLCALTTYHWIVRNSWLGWLLNGQHQRSSRKNGFHRNTRSHAV